LAEVICSNLSRPILRASISWAILGSLYNWYNGYQVFLGGKAAGEWPWPPTPSSAEIKERVELYMYATSEPSWPVIGWTSPLCSPYIVGTILKVLCHKSEGRWFNPRWCHWICLLT
jgi:hypothetical protein